MLNIIFTLKQIDLTEVFFSNEKTVLTHSTVTEWFGYEVVNKKKSYISQEIDFLQILIDVKDKYN